MQNTLKHLEKQSELVGNITYEAAYQWLTAHLSEYRLLHSVGVYEKATQLARQFGLSDLVVSQVATAGLLHDVAKLMNPVSLRSYAEEYKITLSAEDNASPQTLHPIIGAAMVQKHLGIDDIEVLNAIFYHTTGRPEMSVVEKIVYIADKIEERTRDPQWIKQVSNVLNPSTLTSLDDTVRFLLENTVASVQARGAVLHPRTQAALDDLKNSKKRYDKIQSENLKFSAL